jgi:hypothetical protein
MEINGVVSWVVNLVVSFIITSFFVAILHTRVGRERIAENAKSSNEFREYLITGCSTHINNRLIITAEKTNDMGEINIEFHPPVIDYVFGDHKSSFNLHANRRVFIMPTNTDTYTIKIKSGDNYPIMYSIEYEWEGFDLIKFLLSKLK